MRDRVSKWIAEHDSIVAPGRIIDVHVNELDDSLSPRDRWIGGVQRVLAEGTVLIGAERTLAGCVSLRSSSERVGINFRDEAELFRELDRTPPSIYLFQVGSEPWNDQNHDFVRVDPPLALSILANATTLYLEYKEPLEAEFRRSLWVVPRR